MKIMQPILINKWEIHVQSQHLNPKKNYDNQTLMLNHNTSCIFGVIISHMEILVPWVQNDKEI